MSGFINKITEHLGELSAAHQNVASYMLYNIDKVAFGTVEELSRQIGVSTTTVIRFAQRLGYRGFSDLQKDAQQIVLTKSDNNVDTSQTAHLPAIHALLESYQQDMQNVTATFSNLTVQQLDQAVQWMQEGKCLYLLGLRMAFTLSYYAYASWGRMRRNIRLVHMEGLEYPEDMLNMKQGDVCVCFAFPRYVADTLRLLKWMRKQGVWVILITGARKSILWDMADLVLPCHVKSSSYQNSYSAPLALVNYFTKALSGLNQKTISDLLRNSEELLGEDFYLSN